MELIFLTSIFIFMLGAILGSFLNVISLEIEPNIFLNKKERDHKKIKSFWKRINRRSKCPNCSQNLSWSELVPILSWIFLLGKCKKCKKNISPRYFLVEIFSGLVFLGFFWEIINNLNIYNLIFLQNVVLIEFIFLIPIISAIILIFLFDWKHKIIPDVIIIPVFLYTLIYIVFDFQALSFDFSNFLTDIWRSILFALPFFAIWLVSRGKAMGFADWKLILLLSLLLENPMQNLLFAMGAFWVGAIYVIPLLIFNKKNNLKSEIPFGPFIIISFFIVYFFNLNLFSFMNFF